MKSTNLIEQSANVLSVILEKLNELVKQLNYDVKRPREMKEDIEIKC